MKTAQGYLNREELLAAVERLKLQIENMKDSRRNPQAIPNLQVALAEIEGYLAEMGPDTGAVAN